MNPLFSCPPPPFLRFSITFACGQIRAICRPAGFPDGGEISKADRIRPFMQQLPPFSSHSPVRYQLFASSPFSWSWLSLPNTPIKLNAVGHRTWSRDSTLKLARANFLAPFLATVPQPPYLQLGGGWVWAHELRRHRCELVWVCLPFP